MRLDVEVLKTDDINQFGYEYAQEGDDLVLSVSISEEETVSAAEYDASKPSPIELKFSRDNEPFIPNLSKHHHDTQKGAIWWVWYTSGVKPGNYTVEAVPHPEFLKEPSAGSDSPEKSLAKAKKITGRH